MCSIYVTVAYLIAEHIQEGPKKRMLLDSVCDEHHLAPLWRFVILATVVTVWTYLHSVHSYDFQY